MVTRRTKMLMASSSMLIDSATGSGTPLPCSIALAWARIFCVLGRLRQQRRRWGEGRDGLVEEEAGEDGQAAVERDRLGHGERAHRRRRQDHRRQARQRDDAEAGEERAADVEVLVVLGLSQMSARWQHL